MIPKASCIKITPSATGPFLTKLGTFTDIPALNSMDNMASCARSCSSTYVTIPVVGPRNTPAKTYAGIRDCLMKRANSAERQIEIDIIAILVK